MGRHVRSKPSATVFVVSDSSGRTAERLVRAALVQFAGTGADVVRIGQINSPRRASSVVRKAAAKKALLVHTIVSTELRRRMLEQARERGVDTMDLMGPLLRRLQARLGAAPLETPGLFQQLNEERAREIEAVEFAFHHDDGRNVEELERAEIVLTGVSRTMKTPTMLYLAYRGWFAANVPIVPDQPPPSELIALSPGRVFYLDMSPARLVLLRRTRAAAGRIAASGYSSADQTARELLFARGLARRYHWQTIDVTGKSVEDVAQTILSLRGDE